MRKDKIQIINLNKYERIDTSNLLNFGNKFVTNGTDNEFFYELDDRYYGSPTNASVINSYVHYVMGEGLIAKEGIEQETLEQIIDPNDLKNIILELKKTGNSPIQVVYAKLPDKKKVAKLYSLQTKQVAIVNQEDLSEDIKEFWFSYDWKLRTKFRPYKVPSFGRGKNKQSEIFYLKNNWQEPLFSLPDWVSGVQFAQMEEEVSNYMINHIKNNFSAGKIVNIYQGEAEDEEAEEEAERIIKQRLSGSSNAGNIILAFNKNPDEKTEVENIEVTDAYQQFDFVSKYAKEQIFTAHAVTSPSLFGADSDTGFSSDSEQMKTALRTLYRSQINPIRRKVINAIEMILNNSYPDIKLKFKDFEELNEDLIK